MVVDETGEVGGYGHVPGSESVLGYHARVARVPPGKDHADIMLQVIRNHSPQALVVDEMVHPKDIAAATTCASRGIQLLATVHAGSIENILENPVFRDALGGRQQAAVSDTMALDVGSKFVSARKHEPVFRGAYDVSKGVLYTNLANVVDNMYKKH